MSKVTKLSAKAGAFFGKATRNKKLVKNVKIVVIGIVVLGVLYLAKGLFVAAIVNGVPVSRISLVKELEKQGGSDVLSSLITEKLIFQEASKNKIEVAQEEIDKEISTIEEQLVAQGMDLESALSLQGQTKADLERNLKIRIILEKILADKIGVTDQEVKDYFTQNKTLYEGKTLDEVKSDVTTTLKQQKLSTEYQTWIADLKDKAKITYFVNF